MILGMVSSIAKIDTMGHAITEKPAMIPSKKEKKNQQ
jgi:hypothetical protein